MRLLGLYCVTVALGAFFVAPPVSAQSIQGIGAYFSHSSSYALAVSDDGSVVLASVSAGATQPMRWTGSGGLQLLEVPTGALATFGVGINADGSVVVGHLLSRDASGACRWLIGPKGEAFDNEFFLPGGFATAVSDDGSVVVGTKTYDYGVQRAFRWTCETGLVALPLVSGDNFSEGYGTSADGSVVVGRSGLTPAVVDHALYWSSATGTVDLGFPPEGTSTVAYGVSGNGLVVVGQGGSYGDTGVCRWTSETGMVKLAGTASAGFATNSDGSMVVGRIADRAFLWTPALGVVDLRAYVASLGADVANWELNNAADISADGRVIVGTGYHFRGNDGWVEEGWVVTLPGCFSVATGSNRLAACAGRSKALTVTPTGTGPFTYRWRHRGYPVDPVLNPSAVTSSLVLNSVTPADAGSYDCVVSNSCATVTSNPISIHLIPDLNGDGSVNTGDLVQLLLRFGSSTPPGSPGYQADLDGNGVVDSADLVLLLASFSETCL